MIIWIGYIIFLIIGSEIFSYFWHKYGGHTNLSSYIRDIHKIHHMISLDENHDANEDFVWILLLIDENIFIKKKLNFSSHLGNNGGIFVEMASSQPRWRGALPSRLHEK